MVKIQQLTCYSSNQTTSTCKVLHVIILQHCCTCGDCAYTGRAILFTKNAHKPISAVSIYFCVYASHDSCVCEVLNNFGKNFCDSIANTMNQWKVDCTMENIIMPPHVDQLCKFIKMVNPGNCTIFMHLYT